MIFRQIRQGRLQRQLRQRLGGVQDQIQKGERARPEALVCPNLHPEVPSHVGKGAGQADGASDQEASAVSNAVSKRFIS